MMRIKAGVLLLALLIVGPSFAKTWQVEKDGSGDFSIIQDAVNLAADGDTIFIGPGRYEEYETTGSNGRSTHIYVNLFGKSLTLQGAGTDQTFIGPEEIDFHPWPGTYVYILGAIGCTELAINDLTMDHSPWVMLRMQDVGTMRVANCTFKEGQYGVSGALTGSGIISNCLFEDLTSCGVAISDPTPTFRVEYCIFNNVFVPVGVDWSPAHCDVVNCQMDGGRVGVKFAGGGGGSVSNCTIRNFENYGVVASDDGDITITNNIIEQTDGWGMYISVAENTVIRQNSISTQTGKCLKLFYPSNGMIFEGNDLSRGEGDFATTNDYWPYNPPTYFHLENNYWGTTDAEEISAHILDGHYFENSNMFVLFEPFADDSVVQTQKKSFSSMKAMFR